MQAGSTDTVRKNGGKMKPKKILFITGTRADYGKIKTLMKSMDTMDEFDIFIYVSGMHLLSLYGNTYKEVLKDNYKNVHVAFGQKYTNSMSHNLGDVITDLTDYVEEIKPDMIVVHGDRSDALAGAIVGALNNILVGHIEGGEISGTIDDSIRHAITKFAHLHFVCNEDAKRRLMQMGENEKRIFLIGSPDIDVMLHLPLQPLEEVKKYYDIPFSSYAICMYHPVTTEYDLLEGHIKNLITACKKSGRKFIVVYPNNDLGTEIILKEYEKLNDREQFVCYPSLRFEYFLTLLKNAEFVIGNSSAGIRETGIYGIPAIDVGTRQMRRYDIHKLKNIQHVSENPKEILAAISKVDNYRIKNKIFGDGNSTKTFVEILKEEKTWELDIQKQFIDWER